MCLFYEDKQNCIDRVFPFLFCCICQICVEYLEILVIYLGDIITCVLFQINTSVTIAIYQYKIILILIKLILGEE